MFYRLRYRTTMWMFAICPSRFRVRLFDVIEASRFLDIDQLENITNVYPEFYETN